MPVLVVRFLERQGGVFAPPGSVFRSENPHTVSPKNGETRVGHPPVGRATENPSILFCMVKRRRNAPVPDDSMFTVRRKTVPHEFVLDAIASLSPETRPMFGCLAVYVRDKIVCVLRHKRNETAEDDGMWLATTVEHHASLHQDFPSMRSIRVLGKKVTGWQVLPVDAPDFEEAALRACEFILAGDPRIGKVPASRRAADDKKIAKTRAHKRNGKARNK